MPLSTQKERRAAEATRRDPAAAAGFTLIEMMAVLLIICILVSLAIGAYWKARDTAWREKARDTARQLAIAWNMRLVDDTKFPDSIPDSGNNSVSGAPSVNPADGLEPTFATTGANMALVCVASNNTQSRVYFEQNATQRSLTLSGGLKDHWDHYFYVTLDKDYDGTIKSPVDGSTIHANVIVWSMGKRPDKKEEWVVAFQ